MVNKIHLRVQGTTCGSCEVLIERRWRKIPGIEKVHVNHSTGKATIECSREPNLAELQTALGEGKYTVSRDAAYDGKAHDTTKREYAEIGIAFLIVVALYVIIKQFDLLPQGFGISDNMGYGMAFGIGLVAALSTCLAVTGGLLLAIAVKHNERHPELTGYRKFKPHLYFNVGRIVGYTLLGGAIGALGSLLTISVKVTGILMIVVSVIMILLGLQLLHLFPQLRRFQPKMPKFIAHKLYDISHKEHPAAAFLLGGGSFFLPCGFTMALQLYVLSKGDAVTGALTMLAFSLGTMPALLSVGALSSFAKGNFQRYFLKFAGVVVIMLGIFSIGNGLVLAGDGLHLKELFKINAVSASGSVDPNVRIADGKQIVDMRLEGMTYSPHQFTVMQGIPVEWRIDGRTAEGCAQVLTVPKLGITEYLPRDRIKTITFTPTETGTISFSCPMGMTTSGAAFLVVPNPQGATGNAMLATAKTEEACDAGSADCDVQKLEMEITRERGFSPNFFTVRKGVPVELTIDTKTPLGGCMSTMVIPKYNVAHRLSLGKSVLRFTPTEIGDLPFTCSMGSRLGQFSVVD